MAKDALKSVDLYINRELSWLEFNDRVLREGLNTELPLLERAKFLAIVSSNLDEFFMVRVAGLMQQRAAGVRRRDFSGLSPAAQLTRISDRVHAMVAEQSEGVAAVLGLLADERLSVLSRQQWNDAQRERLAKHFAREILPILTPLAVQDLDPIPLLPGLQLYVAVLLRRNGKGAAEADRRKIAVVPVPTQLRRFVPLPAEEGAQFALLEDVIADNAALAFPGCEIVAATCFRITRDADVDVRDDDAGDLLHAIEEAVLARRRRAAVRLEIVAGANRHVRKWLTGWLGVRNEDIYEIDGMLDATALWQLAGLEGFDKLRSPDWPPQPPRDLIGCDDLWEAVQDHDVLLFHPYESFDPVIQLLEQAAADPDVLAIKQTLYRTSGDSPIVRALERAGQSGKEVTVLVELKARFDEARNINWARRLEDAGCHVIYGIANYKTHSKALLIVRRESGRIRRYAHLATGNYNDKTARLYSDLGLLTCDRDIATDVAAFFNLLTGYSETVGWSKLTIAPTGLRQRFIDLIEREIQVSTADSPGLIRAKVNSLQDAEIIRALYRASQAGVKVQLNVRGICCLRPGIKGFSDNIEVTSIIDRFLEHARIFHFRNGGHEEVYLGSADWMRRNLSRRLEILFPIIDRNLRRRVIDILDTFLADNVKARRLRPDGVYELVVRSGPKIRAQEKLYREAVEAFRLSEKSAPQFRPIERPKEA
ncbi:MAG: polyphosphate kinase 1 [Thermoguttaceae bacterium]|jgi:polyphosphate kinase|nr:polyphosphate kinase 1 [Thermoguttaceae bacterium]